MDTSTTISSLIGGWFRAIAVAVEERRLDLVCSPDLLTELDAVLRRPRMQTVMSARQAALALELYAQRAVFVEPGPAPRICRDPNDDYLLALAAAGAADYLVTRDEDLLVLQSHEGTQIVYPARFLQLLHPHG